MNIQIKCTSCNSDLELIEVRKIREDLDTIKILKTSCKACDSIVFVRVAIDVFW